MERRSSRSRRHPSPPAFAEDGSERLRRARSMDGERKSSSLPAMSSLVCCGYGANFIVGSNADSVSADPRIDTMNELVFEEGMRRGGRDRLAETSSERTAQLSPSRTRPAGHGQQRNPNFSSLGIVEGSWLRLSFSLLF